MAKLIQEFFRVILSHGRTKSSTNVSVRVRLYSDIKHTIECMKVRRDTDPMKVELRVLEAAECLLKQDSHLLACDLNERSITHKFAEHLQREFPEWNVDCEYNRIITTRND